MDNNLTCQTHTPADISNRYEGPWTQRKTDNGSHEIVHEKTGTVLATLPAFAAPIAEWMCFARDALPALLADNAALHRRNAALLDSAKQLLRARSAPR
ncbi:hypothetical protein [Streptomyces collinus]|uniref:hypothetical protein n=1 Tax=Streptomyces collinus TaxID=42684 RepID=UPI00382041E9